MRVKYELIIYWSDKDEAFIVDVPELSGCMADGKTYGEAVANAERVIRTSLEQQVSEVRTSLEQQVSEVREEVGALKEGQTIIRERLGVIQQRVTGMDQRITANEQRVNTHSHL
jgi:predicted RNase H-like HicB family nuclease